ncbi:MAG: diacylglycerol/lipid kinase family protein [Ruminococcus sp.]
MRHIFIINPVAGKVNRTEEIKSKIAQLGLAENEVEILITEGVGEAQRLARSLAHSSDGELRIYACGGDGTANEVMSGIVGCDNCSMGVIPIGSGNDFIRSVKGCKREDFLDLKKMIKGKARKIDLIECGGRYAMNIFSVGFDCAVANNVQRFKKLPLVSGSLAYKISIIYCLFTKRKHRLRVWLDGKRLGFADYNRTTLLAIGGNGSFYGGGIKAAPLAVLDDGLLDFVHIETVSALKFISLLGKYIRGEHINNPKLPFVYFKRGRTVRFEAEKPLAVNFDGEILEMENPEIRIIPGALNIIEPDRDYA